MLACMPVVFALSNEIQLRCGVRKFHRFDRINDTSMSTEWIWRLERYAYILLGIWMRLHLLRRSNRDRTYPEFSEKFRHCTYTTDFVIWSLFSIFVWHTYSGICVRMFTYVTCKFSNHVRSISFVNRKYGINKRNSSNTVWLTIAIAVATATTQRWQSVHLMFQSVFNVRWVYKYW